MTPLASECRKYKIGFVITSYVKAIMLVAIDM